MDSILWLLTLPAIGIGWMLCDIDKNRDDKQRETKDSGGSIQCSKS
jgi:hypothetical protein